MSLIQNALIEEHPEDTLVNIQSVLLFLQYLHSDLATSDATPSPISHHGLSLILKCSNDALAYEMDRLEMLSNAENKTAVFEA